MLEKIDSKEVMMLDYRTMVDAVKKVTGLDVPVVFNCLQANCGGSCYYGLGDSAWDLFDPEDLENPMICLEDLIEDCHLPHYHIGLQSNITREDFYTTVIQELLLDNNIQVELSKSMLELYVILHEFGHAHQLMVAYDGKVEKYLAETRQDREFIVYKVKNLDLDPIEGFRLYKTIPAEQYADSFAVKYLVQTGKLLGLIS